LLLAARVFAPGAADPLAPVTLSMSRLGDIAIGMHVEGGP
jgi:hypothetical protein